MYTKSEGIYIYIYTYIGVELADEAGEVVVLKVVGE